MWLQGPLNNVAISLLLCMFVTLLEMIYHRIENYHINIYFGLLPGDV